MSVYLLGEVTAYIFRKVKEFNGKSEGDGGRWHGIM
jgi:hypothetical protein